MISKIKNFVKAGIDKLPYIRAMKQKLSFYETELLVKPGHFYSPIASQEELQAARTKIFDVNKIVLGIDFNETEQYDLLNKLKDYYNLLPFANKAGGNTRYYFENDAFLYADGIFLFSMLHHLKPKRIIEIGSGFSSSLMLDTNELFFQNSIDITFVEPFPDTLKTILKPADRYTLIEKMVQDVDLSIFKKLDENDILFIDSTHVAKTNSDVLFELFEILPNLKKGVKIHIHDIFNLFEYPEEWVIEQKRNWNEIYFVQSFLMYNSHFKIIAFNTYLEEKHTSWFEENMPLCLKNRGGSIWLEKIL